MENNKLTEFMDVMTKAYYNKSIFFLSDFFQSETRIVFLLLKNVIGFKHLGFLRELFHERPHRCKVGAGALKNIVVVGACRNKVDAEVMPEAGDFRIGRAG